MPIDAHGNAEWTLDTRIKMFTAFIEFKGNLKIQPSAVKNWDALLSFFQDSKYLQAPPKGYAAERVFFLISLHQGEANVHASINTGTVANTLIKNIIRLIGDANGLLWPYLFGNLSGAAAYLAVTEVFNAMEPELQASLQTLEPSDIKTEFDASTLAESESVVEFYATINKNIKGVKTAVSSVYPPIENIAVNQTESGQQEFYTSLMQSVEVNRKASVAHAAAGADKDNGDTQKGAPRTTPPPPPPPSTLNRAHKHSNDEIGRGQDPAVRLQTRSLKNERARPRASRIIPRACAFLILKQSQREECTNLEQKNLDQVSISKLTH